LLAADDRRAVSIQVEHSLPALLVDGPVAQGLESKLGFLHYALDPEGDGRGPFQVTRIPLAQLTPSLLQSVRVVALGDVRVLEPAMVDALERFVVAGGGILVGLGPDSDRDMINRYWARNGEGFLPCPLANAITPPVPAIPAGIAVGHCVFSGFGAKSDQAWKATRIKSYFKLDLPKAQAAELDTLLSLDNGDPLVVDRRRGLGLVTLVTTSLNADWSDLPIQAAYVPLMRGIVGHLGSFVMPPRNLQPGEQIIYARAEDPKTNFEAADPSGKPLKLTLGAWEGRDAVLSDPLMEPGVYLLRDPGEPGPIRYAVSIRATESPLTPITDNEVSQFFDRDLTILHSPEQIAANLDPTRRQSVELWKWLIAAALLLMFVEAGLTRREASLAAGKGGS